MMMTPTQRLSTTAVRRSEHSDAAGSIVALLVRFPEIATIASRPAGSGVELSFIIQRSVGTAERAAVRDDVAGHTHALLELGLAQPQMLEIAWESEARITFLRIRRDAATLSREELAMTAALLARRFGDALLLAPSGDDASEDDAAFADDAVEAALERLRDPSTSSGLVGFREEKRVVVYFQAARKKAKAPARS